MTSGVGLDANRKAKMTRALSFPVSSSARSGSAQQHISPRPW